MLQSLLWHCHHPAHMGVCGLHASLWGSLNHQHSIVGYWAVLGLKRCECPLVLGYHVWGYVKIIHIQIARQMILLAWGSLFKLAPGANTQLHWVNAWTHQHVLDASIEGFWHVLSDNLTDTHIMLLQMCKTTQYLGGVSVPLDIWPLVLHQSLLLSLSPSCPPEDRSRVSCHSAIWMPNTWKRLATWPKLRQQTHSKSQRERWKMLKTLKGSCWCPFYIFFQRISPKKKHGEHVPICSNSGHLPGFVATNFSCTSLLVGFAAIIGPAPKRFDTAFWGLTWTGSRPNAPSSRPHSTSNSMGLLLDSHGDGHLRSVRPLKISRVFVFSTCIVL